MIHTPLSQLICYGFCDPASGKQVIKRVRARSAIIIIGVDLWQRIFVLYAWAGRPTTPMLVKRLIEVGERFRLKRFGIEANAMQALFADLVAHQAKELKKRIPFISINQSTRMDKDFRIRASLQPVVGTDNGRLFLQENQTELKTEIITFPVGGTKDLIDALASAVRLVPRKTIAQKRSSEVEALARYLRETGAAPDYIQRRIAEVIAEEDERDQQLVMDESLDFSQN